MAVISRNRASSWLPFGRLNLKWNPFGELTAEQRVAAALVDAQQWTKWLAPGGRRALQFVGDSGRGKTTHLLALAAQFDAASYVYLPADGPTPPIPAGAPVLVDEAQRMPWRWRRRLLDAGRTLVLGTHRDLSRLLRRAGYLVRTTTPAEATDGRRIRAMMNRRLDLARLAAGPVPQLSADDGAALAIRFGDDVRAIERFLYEQLQRYAGEEHGQVRFID